LRRLIAFDCDKIGNLGNLSRIDPTLLATKDLGAYTKNLLHLYGQSSEPLLCFSLVVVMNDNLENGRTFASSDPKTPWVVKEIDAVLPSLELERLVAVLGLVFRLPYVPDDSARAATDLLHFTIVDGAFSFTTVMALQSGERCLYSMNGFILIFYNRS